MDRSAAFRALNLTEASTRQSIRDRVDVCRQDLLERLEAATADDRRDRYRAKLSRLEEISAILLGTTNNALKR